MTELSREEAVDRLRRLIETVETDPMPVPVREVWVFGEAALGVDPVERLDVYLCKDILLGEETRRSSGGNEATVPEPDTAPELEGVEGIGRTVRAEWASQYPEYVRTNASGHVAPEKCLAAHLLDEDEPVHLEVCNAGFEDNVTQRLKGARLRENYERILDPRGVALWIDGQRDPEALGKLRAGEYVFPTLPDALETLGLDPEEAERAADAVSRFRGRQEGPSVRADVV